MKILVIDDEPLVRRSIVRAFRSKGHEVEEAEDGLIGEKMWLESHPELVFLDVLMPGLTGPQLLERMVSHNAKVILMSAYSGDNDIEKEVHSSADLFISKPFEDIFAIVKLAESLIEKNPV